MKTLQKIGVALYINGNPMSREGNWACEFRGQPFEFSAANDLPAQTLWITNVDYKELGEAGLRRKPNIAHEGFFRTRLSQIGQELGVGNLDYREQVAILVEVLGMAAEMSKIHLGIASYPANGISHAVGQLYGFTGPAEGSAVHLVAERACQQYTSCERDRRLEDVEIFTFWAPRFEWANRILGSPLPVSTGLKSIALHNLPRMGEDVGALVEWAQERSLPIFARVVIHGLADSVGKLLNYGSGAQTLASRAGSSAGYEARNMREWCSLPELAVLAEVGDLDVKEVVIAPAWTNSGLSLFSSKASSVSYSYGVVAENLWCGLTRSTSPDGRVAKTLSTAWIQSIDRMECLKIAERLVTVGFDVINYGYGRITVACPKSIRALIPRVARENKLLYPARLDNLIPITPNQRSAIDVSQALLVNKDYANIFKVNSMTLSELSASRN